MIIRDIHIREYNRIHYWLLRSFGKSDKCEGEQCSGKSKTYTWALKPNKRYEKERENFIQLCRSCHTKLDWTDDGKRRLSEFHKGRKLSQETRKRMSKSLTGRTLSEEHIENMSKALKARFKRLGYMNSPETRKKLSKALMGNQNALKKEVIYDK